MSGRRGAGGEGPCPGDESIAAYLDGRLAAEEAAAMEAHLATCEACYEVFAETARAGTPSRAPSEKDLKLDTNGDLPAAGAASGIENGRKPGERTSLVRRGGTLAWATGLAAAIAASAGLVLLLQRPPRQEATGSLNALVTAASARRLTEARLVGGFAYGPYLGPYRSAPAPEPTSGAPPIDDTKWELYGVAGAIQKVTDSDPSPENVALLGKAYLLLTRLDEAVSSLELASRADERNAMILSDLSAAYFTRAKLQGTDDVKNALETANKALEIDARLPEALFNRALALTEMIGSDDLALEAWRNFLRVDSTSPWAAEARARIKEIQASRKKQARSHESLWERLEAEASLRDSDRALLVKESPSEVRSFVEEVLVPRWEEEAKSGDAAAAAEIARAIRRLGVAHEAETGDHWLTARAEEFESAAEAGRLDAQVVAERESTFRLGMRLYEAGDIRGSAGVLARLDERALANERPARGAFQLRLELQRAINAYFETPHDLDRFDRIEDEARAGGFKLLEAKALWTKGVMLAREGAAMPAIEAYETARGLLEGVREPSQIAALDARLGEALFHAGFSVKAWRVAVRGLRGLPLDAPPIRRATSLHSLAQIAAAENRQRVAYDLLAALLSQTERLPPAVLLEARLLRALLLAKLGARAAAVADAEEANKSVRSVAEVGLRDFLSSKVEGVRGLFAADQAPAVAVEALTSSLAFARAAQWRQVEPALLTARARHLLRLGDYRRAEADLRQAVDFLDARALRPDDSLRLLTDVTTEALEELVQLLRLQGRGAEEVVDLIERQMEAAAFRSASGLIQKPPSWYRGVLNVTQIAAALDGETRLVYLVPFERSLLVLIVSRLSIEMSSHSWSRARAQQLIAAYELAAVAPGESARLSRAAEAVFSEAVRPWLQKVPASAAIVIAARPPLDRAAFEAARDGSSGAFLVERNPLARARSGSIYSQLREEARRRRHGGRDRILLASSSLPPSVGARDQLGAVERELFSIRRLFRDGDVVYCKGVNDRGLAAALHGASIFHFAGHGTEEGAEDIRMAAEAAEGPGIANPAVGATEVSEFGRFRSVFLASLSMCGGRPGSTRRLQETEDLRRELLFDGVPAVLSSRHAVADTLSAQFFIRFFEALARGGDPVGALQQAQLRLRADYLEKAGRRQRWFDFELVL